MGNETKNKEYITEFENDKYSKPISFESHEIIHEQMKKCICRIEISPKSSGSGFFCMIPFPTKFNLLPVLITNNHVIGEDPNSIAVGAKIHFYVKNGNKSYKIILDKDRKFYTNENFDVTIIELRQTDNLDIDFLEVEIKSGKPSEIYKNENKSVYLLHYPHGRNVEMSNAIIKCFYEDNVNIDHFCASSPGSSGGPLMNLFTHKVIGIHKGSRTGKDWNIATHINEPLKEFNEKYNNNNFNKINIIREQSIKENFDEITLTYKIANGYLVGNLFGDDFVKNNKDKCKIIFNGKEYDLDNSFNFDINNYIFNNDIFEIKLKGITKITNMKSMFEGASSLLNIPDISKWDTSNVKDMSSMFKGCKYLKSIPDISFLKTAHVTNMSYMFGGCCKLVSLPDISNWNTMNVTCMDYLFAGCSSLISFPDLSKWNTSNVVSMASIFGSFKSLFSSYKRHFIYKKEIMIESNSCSNIKFLPNIAKWDTSKVKYMQNMFKGCSKLESLPDLYIWNTLNVINMSGMFSECSSLSSLPDISKWNTLNVIDMSDMFNYCKSLKNLPKFKKK